MGGGGGTPSSPCGGGTPGAPPTIQTWLGGVSWVPPTIQTWDGVLPHPPTDLGWGTPLLASVDRLKILPSPILRMRAVKN